MLLAGACANKNTVVLFQFDARGAVENHQLGMAVTTAKTVTKAAVRRADKV